MTSLAPLPPFTPERVDRFESFVAGFRTAFHRADQFLRFRAYLRGLLEPGERKNLESLAAAAAAVMTVEANLSQALQHFVSSSPWDGDRLLSAARAGHARDPHAVWVVHDGVFAKKGRHSVGVQRQYARALGRKLNCQLAVVVSRAGPRGYFPLAARLYLPGHWLRENAEEAERSVPEPFRRPTSKAQIALELLDGLREEYGPTPRVVAEEGYAAAPEFAERFADQPPPRTKSADADARAAARRGFEWVQFALGLDHFEGRRWHGWHHHVALVLTAYAFLAAERHGPDGPPFS